MERKIRSAKLRKILLGGPIRHAVLAGEFDPSLLVLVTSLLDTLESSGWEVFSAHRAEGFSIESEKFCSQKIVTRDFDWMKRCDLFVAILPPGPEGVLRTDGTHVELGWASALGKPIIAVVPLPIPETYGHMLRGLGSIAQVDYINILDVQKRPEVLREALQRRYCAG
jgi:nucleoside 2-deoxyribosyltransferase